MKKKTTLKKFIMFRYTDLKSICDYLEDMALKGWALKYMTNFTAEFERIEPHRVRYAVELLDTDSAYNSEITEKEQEYIDVCEQAGWEFVCNRKQMYIFRTESEDAPAIVSDDEDKLHNIRKGELKTYFLGWCIFLVWFFLVMLSKITGYVTIDNYFDLYYPVIRVDILIAIILIILFQIIAFIGWNIKASKAVSNDKPIPYVSLKRIKLRKWGVIIPAILLVLYFTVMIIQAENDKDYEGEIREGAEYTYDGKLMMRWDNIPITAKDFGSDKIEFNSVCGWKSFLSCHFNYMSDGNDTVIRYEIFYSKFDSLLNSYIEEMKRDEKVTEGDAASWGAEKLYLLTKKNVIVVYDDYVVYIECSDILEGEDNIIVSTFKEVFDKVS